MFRFLRTPARRNDHRARLGLEALEHRELLASSLTGTLVKAPVATKVSVAPTVLKTVATAPAAKATAQNTLPPANQVVLDRVTKPLTSLGQADAAKLGTAAGQQSLPLSDGPIEAAHNGKADVDLKALAQTRAASVQKGVQDALNALGFGIAPHGGTGTGGLGGSLNRGHLGTDKDKTEQSPLLLTGHAGIDAAIAEMFRSPEDAARDGLARGYNIGDPGQGTGQLSFLQGEKIVLGGREQDGGRTGYSEVYEYAWRDAQNNWVLARNDGGKLPFLTAKDTIHEGNGFFIVRVGQNQEVVPKEGQTVQGSSSKNKDGDTVVTLLKVPGTNAASATTEIVLPKQNSGLVDIKSTDKKGNTDLYQVDPKRTGSDNPKPPALDDQGNLKPQTTDTKKYPSPKDDLSGARSGPLGALPANSVNGLKIPGAEEGRRANADLDKLIRGTVVLAISKVNPPPSQPDQGGGINQGGDLGGDNAGGVIARSAPVTTFKGPRPTPGPG